MAIHNNQRQKCFMWPPAVRHTFAAHKIQYYITNVCRNIQFTL